MYNSADVTWTLVAAFLVFFMQAGFALCEAGLTRAKNTGNILMKNMMDFCIGTPCYWLVGFGIMFAGSGALIGGFDPFIRGSYDFGTLPVWAEAMTIYRSGRYSMKFSKSIQRQLVEVQKDFMPEDTEAGQIQGFLEHYTGSMVCSKQLFKEALGHTYDEPKRWQLHNINEIMNTVVTGWKPFSNPRMFAGYGRQKGWERDVSGNELPGNEDGFVELSEEECRQLELPKEWIA